MLIAGGRRRLSRRSHGRGLLAAHTAWVRHCAVEMRCNRSPLSDNHSHRYGLSMFDHVAQLSAQLFRRRLWLSALVFVVIGVVMNAAQPPFSSTIGLM